MLYAVGNCFLVLAEFSYYIQFAKGDLKLHLIGNLLTVTVFFPLLIWCVSEFGMLGAGYAWITVNLFMFLFWVPIVHMRFVKGLHRRWFFRDIFMLSIFPLIIIYFAQEYIVWPSGQVESFMYIFVLGVVLFLSSVSGSAYARNIIFNKILRRYCD